MREGHLTREAVGRLWVEGETKKPMLADALLVGNQLNQRNEGGMK